ncbi:MAG: helix-turn-helix transcriptional regulator [Candidatus Eisenbacteria bacterium]|uniref:Helix-turn-helix transcriptional regulator n=1 Tax=Eiseniibacteriota bacterium TaxID=2212470 RepID=A0A538U1U0_UNCEI|nr:MAG: helix-turn-helix transcriptional regulator [Candidatus Eisenbacteria bacterium]
MSAGRAHRIAKAIELVRKGYDKRLRISSLARQLGMSTSGLHHHFKAVTAMSPLRPRVPRFPQCVPRHGTSNVLTP